MTRVLLVMTMRWFGEACGISSPRRWERWRSERRANPARPWKSCKRKPGTSWCWTFRCQARRGRRAADMKRLRPTVPVLVLSMHAEEHYALRALRAGASGYVNKEGAAEELAGAVRKVLMGGTHVSARLAETLAKSLSTGSSRPAYERLSDRELEVMRGIATGKTVKEISAGLALSEKTISTYRTRLLEKMQMHSNAELIQYALREGLGRLAFLPAALVGHWPTAESDSSRQR